MSLPIGFPLYFDGRYHVSLSFPPVVPVSEISKVVGVTASYPLLIPNTDYLQNFVKGDIGIADKSMQESLFKNFNNPIASKDKKIIENFSRISNSPIPDIEKLKTGDKYKIPKDNIAIPKMEGVGFKGFEKTILQSIFETQKPYMEIAKLVIGNVAKIEDIIARVAPLLSPSPLTTQSEKPSTNKGKEGGRPKATGFGGGDELKKSLAKLQKFEKKGTLVKISKDGTVKREKNPKSPENKGVTQSTSGGPGTEQTSNGETIWEIVSTVYSTGVFRPEVNYKYTYIDLPPEKEEPEEEVDLDLQDNGDPYEGFKPKTIILGIFDSQGNPLDPNSTLKTIGLNGTTVTQVDTPFKKADWILRSPKWCFPPKGVDNRTYRYSWPVFNTPIYKWERYAGTATQDSQTKPSNGAGTPEWELKKYKEGDKNILNGEDAVPGDPVISGFTGDAENEYRSFFSDLTKFKMWQQDGLEETEKVQYSNEIIGKLNVKAHLENVFLYGQNNSSTYKQINNQPAFPQSLKTSFRPFQIYSYEAAADENLKAYAQRQGKEPGFIWIDPESDYDIKIIRVDPTTQIEYVTAQGEKPLPTVINKFIKNRFIIRLSNGEPFTLAISNNGGATQILDGITDYRLENWNYQNAQVVNSNNILFSIWTTEAPTEYRNQRSIVNDSGYFYEIVKSGNYYTYKKFYFNVDPVDVAATQLLAILSPALLVTLIAMYVANPESEYTFQIPNPNTANESTTNSQLVNLSYTVKLKNLFPYRVYVDLDNTGDIVIKHDKKTMVNVDGSGIIRRWYYVKGKTFSGPSTKVNAETTVTRSTYEEESVTANTGVNTTFLPTFGVEREFVVRIDTPNTSKTGKDYDITYTDKVIPLYNINVQSDNPFGSMIDPSKIRNEQLSTAELFSKGKYGHGSPENPQEIDIVKRYQLTDLDTESYYIVEGILVDQNTQKANPGQSGSGSGAGSEQSGYYMLPHAIGAIKVFISMLVDIFSKLIPAITKLIKLFKNPPSFVTEIIKEKMGEGFSIFSKESFQKFEGAKNLSDKLKNEKPAEKRRQLESHFKDSPLKDHVYVDFKGNYKFLLDGVAMLPFSIFGLQVPFGMDMNFSKIPDSPINLIFKADLLKSKTKNLQQFLKPPIKDFSQLPGADGLAKPLSVTDMKNAGQQNPLDNSIPGFNKSNPNDFEIIDVKYSTGTFINGVNYNYIYITDDQNRVIKEVDEILEKNPDLTVGNAAKEAQDKLEDELKKDPTNQALKDKLKDLKNKLKGQMDSSQPLLKMLLGLVTLPIKIIGGIIEWLLDFFKSLANPLTLPAKMIELLSFSWIMKFFTPKGMLELAGVKFKPEKIAEWCALVNVPAPKIPGEAPKIPDGIELPPDLPYNDATNLGKYLIPDQYEIADLNEFLSMPFMPMLPKYTARQLRENCKFPFRLFWPFICFLEKVINGIIDFIWSVLGIEAIIPAPHIKLCSKSNDPGQMDADELMKVLNGEKPKGQDNQSGGPNASGDATEAFVYDITLDDGTEIKGLDYEKLQEFLKENEDIAYNFKF